MPNWKVTNAEPPTIEFLSYLKFLYFLFNYTLAAVICVTLVDRLKGDQVISHDLNLEFQERPFKLVAKYIKQKLMQKK